MTAHPGKSFDSLDECIVECDKIDDCNHITYTALEGLCRLIKYPAKSFRKYTGGTVFVDRGCKLDNYGKLFYTWFFISKYHDITSNINKILNIFSALFFDVDIDCIWGAWEGQCDCYYGTKYLTRTERVRKRNNGNSCIETTLNQVDCSSAEKDNCGEYLNGIAFKEYVACGILLLFAM